MSSNKEKLKGKVTELEGKAHVEAERSLERMRGKLQQIGGKIVRRVGEVIGDAELALEGKSDELKGRARERANQSNVQGDDQGTGSETDSVTETK